MVIKLYISGISGNKEVKKKQQRVQMILDSKQITYEAIDITEPGKEKDKEFMQQNGKVRECLGKYPLPPQIFNGDDFCGDYDDFDMANEVDELEKFLHIATSPKIMDNGSNHEEDCKHSDKDKCTEKDSKCNSYNPYNYHTIKIKWDSVNGHQEQIIDSSTTENESEAIKEVNENEVNGFAEDGATKETDNDSDPKATNGDIPVPVNNEDKPENDEDEEVKKDQLEVENGDKHISDERTEIEEKENLPPTEVENEGDKDENGGNTTGDDEKEKGDENGELYDKSGQNDTEKDKNESVVDNEEEEENKEITSNNDGENLPKADKGDANESDEENIETDEQKKNDDKESEEDSGGEKRDSNNEEQDESIASEESE